MSARVRLLRVIRGIGAATLVMVMLWPHQQGRVGVSVGSSRCHRSCESSKKPVPIYAVNAAAMPPVKAPARSRTNRKRKSASRSVRDGPVSARQDGVNEESDKVLQRQDERRKLKRLSAAVERFMGHKSDLIWGFCLMVLALSSQFTAVSTSITIGTGLRTGLLRFAGLLALSSLLGFGLHLWKSLKRMQHARSLRRAVSAAALQRNSHTERGARAKELYADLLETELPYLALLHEVLLQAGGYAILASSPGASRSLGYPAALFIAGVATTYGARKREMQWQMIEDGFGDDPDEEINKQTTAS